MFRLSQGTGVCAHSAEILLNKAPKRVVLAILSAAERAAAPRGNPRASPVANLPACLKTIFSTEEAMGELRACTQKAYQEAVAVTRSIEPCDGYMDVLYPIFVRAAYPSPPPPHPFCALLLTSSPRLMQGPVFEEAVQEDLADCLGRDRTIILSLAAPGSLRDPAAGSRTKKFVSVFGALIEKLLNVELLVVDWLPVAVYTDLDAPERDTWMTRGAPAPPASAAAAAAAAGGGATRGPTEALRSGLGGEGSGGGGDGGGRAERQDVEGVLGSAFLELLPADLEGEEGAEEEGEEVEEAKEVVEANVLALLQAAEAKLPAFGGAGGAPAASPAPAAAPFSAPPPPPRRRLRRGAPRGAGTPRCSTCFSPPPPPTCFFLSCGTWLTSPRSRRRRRSSR